MDPDPVPDPAFPSDPSFAGFPTRLAEDIVAYEIHVLDASLSDRAVRDRLREIQNAASQLTRKPLKRYIWQREAFRLDLVKEKGRSWLAGHTSYGDAVEDEWLIVYLLRELSRQFPDAWIRVTDGDGEFLLAEAANVLPKWLNPDVAENRVWFSRGELMIIPQRLPGQEGKASKDEKKFISLPHALSALQGPRENLISSPIIEEEAFFRLRNYPGQIEKNMHHALVTIPRRLAFILHQLPTSISPAIEALYLRDPIALRPLQETSNEKLRFPPHDFVTARIKFNRVGFAQVRSQRFAPLGVWAKVAEESSRVLEAKAKERAEIGMKVASGFEMLVNDPQNQDRQVVREIQLLFEDLEKGDESLPKDEEITAWGINEDDDSWMDIDFRDFEEELKGKGDAERNEKPQDGTGFGDAAAQENLQKLVSRFEQFLNADEMAEDDEDEFEDTDEESDNGEDKDASFSEDEFTALMREMMGMPPEAMQELMGTHAAKASGLGDAEHPDFTEMEEAHRDRLARLFGSLEMDNNSEQQAKGRPQATGKTSGKSMGEQQPAGDESDEEHDEIKKLSALMEAELRKAGALNFSSPKGAKQPRIKDISDKQDSHEEESEDEELLDEDYNLVSNLLQSFKAQAGAAGPSGNLMGMMGVQMPRDEDSGEEGTGAKSGKGKGKAKA